MFFLDLQTLQAGDEGWLVLDVTVASDHWLLNRNKDLGLRLYVETEDGKTQGSGGELSPGGSSEVLAAGTAGAPSIGLEPTPFSCGHWGENALPTVGVSGIKRARFPQFRTAGSPDQRWFPSCPSAEPTLELLRE